VICRTVMSSSGYGRRRRTLTNGGALLGLSAAAALVFSSFSPPAAASGSGARIPLDQTTAPKVDGVLKEWTVPLTLLGVRVSGQTGSTDLGAAVALATDDTHLFVALDITDEKFVRTKALAESEDHVRLTLVFPGEGGSASNTAEILLFPGDPGNVAGAVKRKGGAAIAGASLVEAPRASGGGYSVEAKIPWAALPEGGKTRVGLRGAVRVYDNDGKGIEGVIGTAAEGPSDALPRIPIEAEVSIEDAFAKDKQLTGTPTVDLVADVAGDAQRERIIVWDRWVLITGSHYRGGKEFFFADLGADKAKLSALAVRDVTGDGKPELVFRRKEGAADKYREGFFVQGLGGEALVPLFSQEVAIVTEAGSVSDDVKMAGKEITVTVGSAKGFDAASFHEPTQTTWQPMLLPWGSVKSRSFAWDGTSFAKLREETQTASSSTGPSTGGTAKPASSIAEPAPPRPPTADELLDSVLALYRKDRKLGPHEKPRFDLAANVSEGPENERFLVFGHDLVVFGKAFLGGTAYVSLSLALADKAIVGVTTRDLDGDGRAEILVRGVQRLPAPKEFEVPKGGEIVREVLFVYQVQSTERKLTRVFASETALSVGDKRVASTIAFVPSSTGPGLDLVVGPGRSTGFDGKTWPYKQDSAPVSGIEPLHLPWTDGSTRYKWNGTVFAH
jgi:hypothetical protein